MAGLQIILCYLLREIGDRILYYFYYSCSKDDIIINRVASSSTSSYATYVHYYTNGIAANDYPLLKLDPQHQSTT